MNPDAVAFFVYGIVAIALFVLPLYAIEKVLKMFLGKK